MSTIMCIHTWILTNSTNHTDNTEDKVPLSCTSYSVWNRVRMIKILRTGSYNFSLLGAMKTVHGSHKLEITSLPHMNFTTNKLRNNRFLSPWQISYCIYLSASLHHGLTLRGADLIFQFCLPYRILMVYLWLGEIIVCSLCYQLWLSDGIS